MRTATPIGLLFLVQVHRRLKACLLRVAARRALSPKIVLLVSPVKKERGMTRMCAVLPVVAFSRKVVSGLILLTIPRVQQRTFLVAPNNIALWSQTNPAFVRLLNNSTGKWLLFGRAGFTESARRYSSAKTTVFRVVLEVLHYKESGGIPCTVPLAEMKLLSN